MTKVKKNIEINPQFSRRNIMSNRKFEKIVKNTNVYDNINLLNSVLIGARYIGKTEKDGKRILNKSQNGVSYPYFEKGFPRAHAAYKKSKNYLGSVQNYSKNKRTTAFLNRSDQDFVTHLALDTDTAEEAMDRLNNGSIEEEVEIFANELDYKNLPLGIEYEMGKPVGKPRRIKSVKLILGHHWSSYGNIFADVFVKTIYPKLF
ncbi:uncharacterized protein LOC127277041 isoform X2 [Leptopilina boulardi]|uniref:uncharacterized protein LOC127277041 isoform X2 n=1 Tax=Leptopilina boulardi TaxID=63433 RepID=UPI0021F62A13|nr:uncharacterized protein LOC127277041 isoform X2 [Leptopilina boulardi]